MDEEQLDRFEALETRLACTETELAHLRKALGGVATFQYFSKVKFKAFPGGQLPVRQTEGAIGFDAYARAIVDPKSKPTADNPLRKTLADFNKENDWRRQVNWRLRRKVTADPTDNSKYGIILKPKKRLMVGLGFATGMEFPMFYWVSPRSGYAARGITVVNSPGTVDPDYRGEAGALIENKSREDFLITHNMRIVQVVFALAVIPEIEEVESHDQLGITDRGAGGFGSTGTH